MLYIIFDYTKYSFLVLKQINIAKLKLRFSYFDQEILEKRHTRTHIFIHVQYIKRTKTRRLCNSTVVTAVRISNYPCYFPNFGLMVHYGLIYSRARCFDLIYWMVGALFHRHALALILYEAFIHLLVLKWGSQFINMAHKEHHFTSHDLICYNLFCLKNNFFAYNSKYWDKNNEGERGKPKQKVCMRVSIGI